MRRISSSWNTTLDKLGFRRRPSKKRQVRRNRSIEMLESRHMMSADPIVVDTLDDENDGIHTAGNLSLREAIAIAADEVNHPGHDTIEFAPALFHNGPTTIKLVYDGTDAGTTPDQISINASNVTIDGPGTELLSIDGDGQNRVFYVNWDATLTLRGLTVTGGGNVDAGAGIYNNGVLNIESARITENHTTGLATGNDFGGGIASAGTLRVIESTIDNNQARWGASISFTAWSDTTVLDVRDSAIYENDALDQGGGGLAGALDIKSTSNQAPLSIINTTISNNTAADSAGIRVDWAANLKIVNSTITENEATYGVNGGLMLVNTASGATLHNSIVAGNLDTYGSSHREIVTWGGTFYPESWNNLIGIGNNSGISNGVKGNIVGNSTTPVDAKLAPLGEYGGPTKTHALMNGSPALDAGSDDLAVDAEGLPLETDQRGHQRPYDLPGLANNGSNLVDIGAFEAGNPSTLTVTTTDDELDDIDDPNFDFDDLSLREAIAIAETHEGGEEIYLTGLWGEIYLELGELDIESGIADIETVGPILISPDGYEYYRQNFTFYHIAIIGPGADALSINAHGDSRAFHIEPGSVSIGGMRITGGNTTGNGGGILAEGDLTLSSVVVSSNQAANGGGIYAGRWVDTGWGPQLEGVSLEIFDSTIENNDAIGFSSNTGEGGGVWGAVNEFVYNPNAGQYSESRQITDTTGAPSANLAKVLHESFDIEGDAIWPF